jgi:hypothetical protein
MDFTIRYGLSNCNFTRTLPIAMDLLTAEQTTGRVLIKIGALACFLLAGALLLASLLAPPPAAPGGDGEAPPGSTASVR